MPGFFWWQGCCSHLPGRCLLLWLQPLSLFDPGHKRNRSHKTGLLMDYSFHSHSFLLIAFINILHFLSFFFIPK
ncbi:hypothetical protein CLU79DRAFT_890941 [Phycomyces nitens]|nr:hypothetical protein CLU79DRAFT_890941 [Phycomyces nitens]